MWSDDPRAQEWARQKTDELRAAGEWNPDYSGLAAEVQR